MSTNEMHLTEEDWNSNAARTTNFIVFTILALTIAVIFPFTIVVLLIVALAIVSPAFADSKIFKFPGALWNHSRKKNKEIY